MSYNFPDNPTPGQEYVPPMGGQTYIWQPPRWLVKGVPPAGGGGGDGIEEAPANGQQYARKDSTWAVVSLAGGASVGWADITGKPATFPPTLPIASAAVTGLDGKQSAQDADIATKLNTSAYTANDVRAKLLTVDGPSSGIDADLLDGQEGFFFVDRTNHVGAQLQSTIVNLTSDLSSKAPLASPSLTGVPTAPTALAGTNNTQIATTAYVQANTSNKEPTITGGTTAQYWRGDKTWVDLPPAGIADAPIDGKQYARVNGTWVEVFIPPPVATPFIFDVNGDAVVKIGASIVVRIKPSGLILTKDDVEVFSVSV